MTPTTHKRLITRRNALSLILGGNAAAISGCASHFSMLGYTTEPNYDPEIRTVFVPMFKTRFLETTPYRGVEFTLTRAVVDAIESKTPMKVVSNPSGADSELQGTVLSVSKLVVNRTPYNETREIALYLYVELVWHDLRPGHEGQILTSPKRRERLAPPTEIPFDPTVPPPQIRPDSPENSRVVLSSIGRGIAELGESSTTALQMAIDRMAVQIVSAMEKPWWAFEQGARDRWDGQVLC